MKNLKKVFATLLALTLVMAMSMTALAETTLGESGEQGAFGNPDEPTSQGKMLILEKELKVYNPDQAAVNAPTITYKYTIAPAIVADGTTVTDNSNKHNSGNSVTFLVKPGIGNFEASVSWANDKVDASSAGEKNVKDISIDFSGVVFTGAGVYRYMITETLADGFTYPNTGVTKTTGNHVRYIDVYVRAADTFTDGTSATDWDIYGFTCFVNNVSITDANKTTTAVKTTGFVDGDNGTPDDQSDDILADQYYTYNVEISKTITNDNYAKKTHKFPFTVIFTNEEIQKNISLKTDVKGSPVDITHDAGAPNWSGVAKLGDEEKIIYIGIPMGTDVEVYETNDVTGTTYQVVTTRVGAENETGTDEAVFSGTAPGSAVSQNEKAAHESTKTLFDTTKDTSAGTQAHSAAINNILVTISPTGVVLRIAPYALILVAGLALLVISRRRKVRDEE